MSQDEPFSLSAWVRARPLAVVVALSALVLVLGSAVALSRGEPADDGTDVLAQSTASPTSDALPLTSSSPSATRAAPTTPSVTPTPSATPTPTPTPTTTPSATVTPGTATTTTTAPTAPGATTRPSTTSPTASPSPTATTTTTRPPTATTSPAGRATVIVTNSADEPVTFQINGSSRVLFEGQELTIAFTMRSNGQDSATVGSLPPRTCTQTRSGLGIESGATYRVTITSGATCGSGSGPSLPSGPW